MNCVVFFLFSRRCRTDADDGCCAVRGYKRTNKTWRHAHEKLVFGYNNICGSISSRFAYVHRRAASPHCVCVCMCVRVITGRAARACVPNARRDVRNTTQPARKQPQQSTTSQERSAQTRREYIRRNTKRFLYSVNNESTFHVPPIVSL